MDKIVFAMLALFGFSAMGQLPNKALAVKEIALGERATAFVFPYPTCRRARFTLEPRAGSTVESAHVLVDGRSYRLEKVEGVFSALVDMPGKDGDSRVDFEIKTANGTERFNGKWTFKPRRFEWEGHSIGKAKVILPPFKPIEKRGGKTLGVILRDYSFGELALPVSVKALGRELLAAPMYFEAVIDGKPVRFKGTGAKIKVDKTGYSAFLESAAEAAGVKMEMRGKFEYDGFLWNEVRLAGVAGRDVSRLTLVTPLKNGEMPLMHICAVNTIRDNPTGLLPGGEGVVWEGSKLKRVRKIGIADDMYAYEAVPYVWLGAERRGLSWFVNNTSGMRLEPKKSAVRLVREGDVLRFEADFINRPSKLEDGHRFAFGLEATPVKEVDASSRRYFQTGINQSPTNFIRRLAFVGGNFWNTWARRPYRDDWSLFKVAARQFTRADSSNEFVRVFNETNLRDDPELIEYCKDLKGVGKITQFEYRKMCRDFAYNLCRRARAGTETFRYSDPTLNWDRMEESDYFRSEWSSRKSGYTVALRNYLEPSYIDYILYYHRKEAELGQLGIYFDDMYPMTCRNPDMSCRIDGEGKVHSNFGILEMRELVKRAAVMQHQLGITNRFIQIHMTNCLLVPAFGFATSILSLEHHFGNKIYQQRFSVDYIRAESLGTQVGCESVALDGIFRKDHDLEDWKKNRFRFLTRTQQALLLPAGIKLWMRPAMPYERLDRKEFLKINDALGRFEIWSDDCEFKGFYEDDGAVGGAPEGVNVGTYRRPGKVLAIFGECSGRDAAFQMKVDSARLGLKGELSFRDAESGETIDPARMSVPAWDLRLVEISGGR